MRDSAFGNRGDVGAVRRVEHDEQFAIDAFTEPTLQQGKCRPLFVLSEREVRVRASSSE